MNAQQLIEGAINSYGSNYRKLAYSLQHILEQLYLEFHAINSLPLFKEYQHQLANEIASLEVTIVNVWDRYNNNN